MKIKLEINRDKKENIMDCMSQKERRFWMTCVFILLLLSVLNYVPTDTVKALESIIRVLAG